MNRPHLSASLLAAAMRHFEAAIAASPNFKLAGFATPTAAWFGSQRTKLCNSRC